MTFLEGALGVLLLKAFGGGSTSKAPPPPPPPPQDGGGSLAGTLGGAAGTALTALTGLLGGGGGTAGTAGTTGTLTAATGTAAGGSTAAETTTLSVGGSFAATIGAGGAIAIGWTAIFVLQFVIYNIIDNAIMEWRRFRDSIASFNNPFPHLHDLERELIRRTCDQLGLRYSESPADDTGLRVPDGFGGYLESLNGEDPRLTAFAVSQDYLSVQYEKGTRHRAIVANPFSGADAGAKWYFLQLAARLVAARYVFQLTKYGTALYLSWFGGTPAPTPAADYWAYPLLGGGPPLSSYADALAKFRALGDPTFPIDDVLFAARLAAMLHVAAVVQKDPGIYAPWDPAWYSARLYTGMGLNPTDDGVSLAGSAWSFDVARFKVPSSSLVLNVQALKEAVPIVPYLSGTHVPTPPTLTCLVAT